MKHLFSMSPFLCGGEEYFFSGVRLTVTIALGRPLFRDAKGILNWPQDFSWF